MGKTVTNLSFRPLQLQVLRAMKSAGVKEDWEIMHDKLDGPYAALPPKEEKPRPPLPYGTNLVQVDMSVRNVDEWNAHKLRNYRLRKFNPPSNAPIIDDKAIERRSRKICKLLQLNPHADITDIFFKRAYVEPKKRKQKKFDHEGSARRKKELEDIEDQKRRMSDTSNSSIMKGLLI